MIAPPVETLSKRERPSQPLMELLRRPWRVPGAILDLGLAWMATRAWLMVVPCLAPVLFAGLLGLLAYVGQLTDDEIVVRYLPRAEIATYYHDTATQELCLRRLAGVDMRPEQAYRYAQIYAARGQMDQARVELAKLAPDDQRGYGLAHKWLAIEMLSRQAAATVDRPSLTLVVHHARAAAELLPDDPEAAYVCAKALAQQSRNTEAMVYLGRAANHHPALLLALADLQTKSGQVEKARLSQQRCAEFYRKHVDEHPQDVAGRLNLIQALLPLKQWAEAVRVVQDGLRLQDDARLRAALCDCLVWQFDQLPDEQRTGKAGLSLLNQALAVTQSHSETFRRMRQIMEQAATDDWDVLQARLEDSLVTGTSPLLCHLVLGGGYLRRGEREQARTHLALVTQMDPRGAVVLNNLAWNMAFAAAPDVDQAAALIDMACQLDEGASVPDCAETRGLIRYKQKNFADCVPDLEVAVRAHPDRLHVLLALAEAHRQLGQQAAAEKYLARAREAAQRVRDGSNLTQAR
ncbi:MAG: tetratricopeptide repeat protein [Pirellulaceae bacterium]